MDRTYDTDEQVRIKVLVVGSSVSFRRTVSEAAETQAVVRLVGTALDTAMAVSKLERLEIDVVLMDAAPAILQHDSLLAILNEKFPHIIPIVISDLVGFTTEQEMNIIELGALDFVRKPARAASDEWGRILSGELAPLLEHCRRCVVTRQPGIAGRPCSRTGLRQLKREFREREGGAGGHHRSRGAERPGDLRGSSTVVAGRMPAQDRDAAQPGGALRRREMLPVRVLVVDSDVTFRRAFANLIERMPGVDLTGVVAETAAALTKLQTAEVDVVIMEKHKRCREGELLLDVVDKQFPDVIPIVIGELGGSTPSEIKQIMEHGALDYVTKPTGAAEEEWAGILGYDLVPLLEHCQRCVYQRKTLAKTSRCSRRGLRQLKEEYRTRVGGGDDRRLAEGPGAVGAEVIEPPNGELVARRADRRSRMRRIDLVVIGVSTGGPGALRHVIPKLEKNLNVPVVLVIHLPEVFTSRLADALDNASKIKVVELKEGMHLEPGKVFIAPGGMHTSVVHVPKRTQADRFEVHLLNTPHVNGCRPSVDVTLESIARIKDINVLTVIMTGMGTDGANGVAQIKSAGGYSLTQTKDSCVIYGMPYAVDRKGLSDESVHLDDIGTRINQLVRSGYALRNSVPATKPLA